MFEGDDSFAFILTLPINSSIFNSFLSFLFSILPWLLTLSQDIFLFVYLSLTLYFTVSNISVNFQ